MAGKLKVNRGCPMRTVVDLVPFCQVQEALLDKWVDGFLREIAHLSGALLLKFLGQHALSPNTICENQMLAYREPEEQRASALALSALCRAISGAMFQR
jgi:hypothetical protein